MADPRNISVVIALGEAGRAVLPTIRSVIASKAVGEIDVIVACSASDESLVQSLLGASSLSARVVAASASVADQRNAGVVAARGDLVGIVDAGDIVADDWLDKAASRVVSLKGKVVAHPEVAVTFGARSGWWLQPDDADGTVLLPVAAGWSSTFVASRALLLETPDPDSADAVADAAWQAALTGVGARHVVVAETAVFERVWTAAAPWEFSAAALPRISWLRDTAYGAAAAARLSPPRSVGATLQRRVPWARPALVARAAQAVAEPWVRGAHHVARYRRSGFPPWAMRAWSKANRLDALVPYPRPGVARWYEAVGASHSERLRAALGYWRVLTQLDGEVDYLFFAPWVHTGGGDTVLRQYLAAVLRLDPGARVALVTTEHDESTKLHEVPADVRIAEARDLLAAGVRRDDLVRSIVPTLLHQLAPHTVHAVNSTVAFDVIEQQGEVLADTSRLFLTTFALDRSADGERLSVLFLRRPGFLDPVTSIIVDSHSFVDAVTAELGYDRDKFVVQRSIVEPSAAAETIDRAAAVPELADGKRPLKVFWAGRFDLPKRIDVLAEVARRARATGFPLEVHYYGVEVMGTPGLERSLTALTEAGAVRHPPYSSFAELPLGEFDAYVLTSEWEGIPLTILESMAAGVPVVAPLVGGVGEVLDETTGYPVARFDDPDGYLEAFRAVASDYAGALERAREAHSVVKTRFSSSAFDSVIEGLDGYLRER